MAVRYFLAPYKFRLYGLGLGRYCAVDDFTRDVLTEGGEWRESEIDGNRAIVRVRASPATLARIGRGSDVPIARLDDPAAVWTPYRTAPINRGGEIAFDSGQRHRTLPLSEIIRAVRDDRAQDEYQRRVRPPGSVIGYTRRGLPIFQLAGMAFPTQGVIDNFNRASLGSNWTQVFGTTAISGSTVLSASSVPSVALYNVSTYGADSECYVDVPTVPGTDQYVTVYARMTTLSLATTDGYAVQATKRSTTDEWYINRITNAVPTQLGATISQEYAAGNSIGVEIVSSTIKAYLYSGGSWSDVSGGGRSDATYGSAGYIGVTFSDTTARLDNFGGGTVSAGGSPITVSLTAAALAAGGQSLTPTPGAVSRTLAAAALTAGGQHLSVVAVTSIAVASAALSASGQHLTVTPGAVSKSLSAAALSAGGQHLTVTPGAVSRTLAAAALSAQGQALTITPGAVSKALAAAVLSASGQALVVAPGAISRDLAAASLTAQGPTLGVSTISAINLLAAALAAQGQGISVQPGAVSKALAAAVLSAAGQHLTATPGAVSRALAAAVLSAVGQGLEVQPGAVSKALAAALLAAQGQGVTPSAGSASITIQLLAAVLDLGGQHLTVSPGAVTTALLVAVLSATGQALTVTSFLFEGAGTRKVHAAGGRVVLRAGSRRRDQGAPRDDFEAETPEG